MSICGLVRWTCLLTFLCQDTHIPSHPVHSYSMCQGGFEWQNSFREAKRVCWGCGAEDVHKYTVSPIVEATNMGSVYGIGIVSTPELANLRHRYLKGEEFGGELG